MDTMKGGPVTRFDYKGNEPFLISFILQNNLYVKEKKKEKKELYITKFYMIYPISTI